MYSLDVNFLKDRSQHKQAQSRKFTKLNLPIAGMTPLYLGLAAGLVFPALVGTGWLFIQSQNAQLENQVAAIDAELNRIGIQEENIKKIQAETSQAQAETRALATVFNQIRPWSAMLQDIRDRIPVGVQIQTIKQTAAAAPAATPQQPPAAQPNSNQPPAQPVPSPVSAIEITGIARSFNDVNDFLLTLQQSPFLNATDTRIVTAESVANPVITSQSEQSAPNKIPQVVQYTIQSSVSNVPASEILRELERKGTLGLVTRIRTLQQKGVIQK